MKKPSRLDAMCGKRLASVAPAQKRNKILRPLPNFGLPGLSKNPSVKKIANRANLLCGLQEYVVLGAYLNAECPSCFFDRRGRLRMCWLRALKTLPSSHNTQCRRKKKLKKKYNKNEKAGKHQRFLCPTLIRQDLSVLTFTASLLVQLL